MKILKAGEPVEPPTIGTWWIGQTVLCKRCHALMKLEEGDQHRCDDFDVPLVTRSIIQDYSGQAIIVRCPCGQHIEVREPVEAH